MAVMISIKNDVMISVMMKINISALVALMVFVKKTAVTLLTI